jgi:hypothetical protein
VPRARSSRVWPVAALLAFGLVYSTAFLRLPSRWWFEDDPTLFACASTIHNPASIFTDPEVLRHLTAGAALAPMQLVSYWVDWRLAGFSPQFAYVHQVVSFLLTLLFLYLLLAQLLGGDKLAALAGSVVWSLLPATLVVVQFLATRHYLEGMLFSVVSLYLEERFYLAARGETLSGGKMGTGSNFGQLQLREKMRSGGAEIRACTRFSRTRQWRASAAVISCAAIGMLYKETYAAIVPALLLIAAWRHRDRALAVLTAGLAGLYAIYRSWVLGPGLRYGDMPLLEPWQYAKFLSKLPYTISSNYGGYCVFAAVAALCVYGACRRKAGPEIVLCFAVLCAISLAAIFPVSFPLYGMMRRPDPWYRIVFLLNTMVVAFGTWCAARWAHRWVQAGFVIVALAVVVPGAVKTRKLWVEMTSSAEREGKFYLDHPDRLVLSEQEAYWFLPGIDWMYGVSKPHYVLVKDLATAKLDPGVPLWRFSGGSFVPEGVPDPPRGAVP